mmetsp:Transcript_33757/g.78758  ORF Transcript_33757/g.78758 Transcript_33757/m.78758 type:complete len:165 (-) Transcript_33757:123-617(-)
MIGNRRCLTRSCAWPQLKNTPYQDSVIKETFRLWPASALGPTLRSPDRDIDIGGGKVLPKGCIIACVPKPALRMGIADPDSFIPERWSDPGNPDLEALEQMSHMPFGAGKRVCIGQNLANAEIRMAIASIVQRFDMTLAHEPTTDFFGSLKPGGAKIKPTFREY